MKRGGNCFIYCCKVTFHIPFFCLLLLIPPTPANLADDLTRSITTPESLATPDPVDQQLVRPSLQHPFQDEVLYFLIPDRFNNGSALNNCGAYTGDCVNNDGQSNVLQHGYLPTDKGYYHGGDLKGLREKLPYLRNLGVTAIWVGPIFKNKPVQEDPANLYRHSAGYHGYWIVDFKNVDPHLGTNQDFKELIQKAHEQGLKVFMDIITNHTADVIRYQENDTQYRSKIDMPYRNIQDEAFDDTGFAYAGQPDYNFPPMNLAGFPYTPVIPEAERGLKNPAWLNDPLLYHNRGNSTFAGESALYGDFYGLDDLFTEKKEVVEGMIDIYQYWIEEFEVDGFRIDTTKHVNLEFWQAFGPAILAAAQAQGIDHFFTFGEVFDQQYGPPFLSEFSTTGNLQSTIDFSFQLAAREFASRSGPTDQLRFFFEQDDYYTDADSNAYTMPTFVSNHDIGRLGFFLKEDHPNTGETELLARARLAHALMFFARGQPVIYYGDEQGFTGDGGDKDARQDMFPSQVSTYNDDDLLGTEATTAEANFDENHPLYQVFQSYAHLYQEHRALRRGAQIHRTSTAGPGLYVFSRIDREEKIEYLVAFNNDTQPQTVAVPTFYPPESPFSLISAEVNGQESESLSTNSEGRLVLTVPPLSFAIYRALQSIPPSETAPDISLTTPRAGQRIALRIVNQDGQTLVDRMEVRAEVATGSFVEVTFAVRVGDAADYRVIGTDNNPPYRVFFDIAPALENIPLEFKAIVNDLSGHLNSAEVPQVMADIQEAQPSPVVTNQAIIHYFRPEGDYGDPATAGFNNFWGLHLWGDAIVSSEVTPWSSPKPFLGQDDYGRFAAVSLADPGQNINFIVHRDDIKDGTEANREFNPTADGREVWLKADDPNVYTSQAQAQGYVTIHYRRPAGDYGNYDSNNFIDFWGLHLWTPNGDLTTWTEPKKADGIDDYGAFFIISQANYPDLDFSQPLNFIVHQGDVKDVPPDRGFNPTSTATIWLKQADETIYPARGMAENFATIHYHRDDSNYGDPASNDFTAFWGLHVWDGAANPTPSWQEPLKPAGRDNFGVFFKVPLAEGATELAYILHRGETKDPGPDQFLNLARDGYEVWQLSGADPAAPYLYTLPKRPGGGGDLNKARAHWLAKDTVAWNVSPLPGYTYALHYDPAGQITLEEGQIRGGRTIPLSYDPNGLAQELKDRFPHLANYAAFKLAPADLGRVPEALKSQLAISVMNSDRIVVDASGLQIPGVLDELYAYDGPLGLIYEGSTPTLRLWSPTARSVRLHLFDSAVAATASQVIDMTPEARGTWRASGPPAWTGKYYLYEVEVYAPSSGRIEHNLVTDPYSVGLSMNSQRSLILNLDDPTLKPAGWDDLAKPSLNAPEDIVLYELHLRDFSINDASVPQADRGTFRAFTHPDSAGMTHLKNLARAGLTHLHLLPVFDFATTNENTAEWLEPDIPDAPPESDLQQAAVSAVKDRDGFNWGYDPFHYTVPEGSYSTAPDGPARTLEFRQMVQALNQSGLRLVMDVVYNHTAASGQDPYSVLDRIVPGYYHRLNRDGQVETSTCCQNTATEHYMMEKLMIDSLVTWATAYKVDGFRFDLMGHHTKANMEKVRDTLQTLTLAEDGVDGSKIYLYGEGWDFGEVADNGRGINATQSNMAGTGIGTFNDRLRDAVRGGGPFDEGENLLINQGFANGLFYDPNSLAAANISTPDQEDRLLLAADQIRVGLAGNLAEYPLLDRNGEMVTGAGIDYNGRPAGYSQDPQEQIVYISAHDNQTLYDINQYKIPAGRDLADRVRVQNLGLSLVALSQGIPLFHAGSDMLRSKSLDWDSYNSGDWFNRLDFSYQTNNWGVGLPPAEVNAGNWDFMRPLLTDPTLKPSPEEIMKSVVHLQEMLAIRKSSPLFRLGSKQAVIDRLTFYNTGPSQHHGLIVMSLSDKLILDLDPSYASIIVLFNANTKPQTFTEPALAGLNLQLHPIQATSVDPIVQTATYDNTNGTFTIPARTTAVFVEPE